MKLEIIKEKLLESLLLVEKISGKNLTLPVLHCVLLHAEGKQLTLRATNLELGIETTIHAQVEKEGIAAVPGSVLANVASTLPSGSRVTIELKDGNVIVTSAGTSTKIKIFDPEEFPTLPKVEGGVKLTIKAEDLTRGIKSVAYSASVSTIKPELGSVFIAPKGSQLVFAATDSFRLAEKTVPVEHAAVGDPFLIPTRSVADIVRVLETAKGEIEVCYNEHQVSFLFDGTYLTSRLVEGTFPDYGQIVPKESTTEVMILRQDLIGALRKASIFSDRFHQVRFVVDPKKKYFGIYAENADVGEITDELSAHQIKGEELKISFNLRFINDCFQSIASDSIILALGGVSRPMIIRGNSDQSFFYLIMPMNK